MISCDPSILAFFVRDLQIEGCEVHLYSGPKTFGCLLTEENAGRAIEEFGAHDLYFLAGVRPGMTTRAADRDVLKRGMFTCDFDIRKTLVKRKEPATDADVARMAEIIIAQLDAHETWKRYRYAVHSGNGLQIHYFGTQVEVHEEEWAAGMGYTFQSISECTEIPADSCMKNAGRIARLPGSWNIKGEQNEALWKPVPFLRHKSDDALFDLVLILEEGRARLRVEEEQRTRELRDGGGGELFDIINAIPIEEVVRALPLNCPREKKKRDGGIHFYGGNGGLAAFFKHKEHNIIVHGGTQHLTERKGYNCLSLVKEVLQCSTKEAIEWFAERSSRVRDARERGREQWVAEKRKQEVNAFSRALSSVSV